MTWGRDGRDTPGVGSQVPGDKHPQPDSFSLPELGSQGMQPQSRCWERTSPWQGEMGGEMSCGARRSLGCRGSQQRGHPMLAPVRHQPCQGQNILPQAPSTACLCLPPAMPGGLQNLCFFNKALHLGKALGGCAVLGAECPEN